MPTIQSAPFQKMAFPFVLIVLLSLSAEAQVTGSFVDLRDQQVYETVTYALNESIQVITDHDEYGTYLTGEAQQVELSLQQGLPASMTWMAQNLNVEMAESRCQYDSDTDCQRYGRLYTWEAANKACPAGWHLPSDEEWYVLASLYEGVDSAGQHLKSTSLGGTNKSRFNIKKPSIFWSSTELDSASAMDWKVNFRWKKPQGWKGRKELHNAVSCVQDYMEE